MPSLSAANENVKFILPRIYKSFVRIRSVFSTDNKSTARLVPYFISRVSESWQTLNDNEFKKKKLSPLPGISIILHEIQLFYARTVDCKIILTASEISAIFQSLQYINPKSLRSVSVLYSFLYENCRNFENFEISDYLINVNKTVYAIDFYYNIKSINL